MIELSILFLLIIIGVLIFSVVRMYKKIMFYEVLVDNIYITLENTYTQLRDIDKMGAFEADDEVGYIFRAIKDTMANTEQELNKMKGDE